MPGDSGANGSPPASTSSLLTTGEGAKYLRLSERAIRAMAADGRLPAVRMGRSVRFLIPDLDGFIAAHRSNGDQS